MTIHKELESLDGAVQAVRKLYDSGEELNQQELTMIRQCADALGTYLKHWGEKKESENV